MIDPFRFGRSFDQKSFLFFVFFIGSRVKSLFSEWKVREKSSESIGILRKAGMNVFAFFTDHPQKVGSCASACAGTVAYTIHIQKVDTGSDSMAYLHRMGPRGSVGFRDFLPEYEERKQAPNLRIFLYF